jgi:hypothetical protein
MYASDNGFFAGAQHLEVRVFPQVDAVLVICCVLAVVLFGGGAALPSPGAVEPYTMGTH